MFKKENKKFKFFNINKKKAELTTQQIVIMIVLIASFAIILIFFFTLDLGKTTDAQICHNSVVMASKNKLGGEVNCNIQYTCIALKNDDCSNFNYNKKIEIELDEQSITTTRTELSKAIANEMATCWWMFGQGKIDYAQDLKGIHCAICNELMFGDKLQKKMNLKYSDFIKDISRQKKDESQTFLRYLYETSSINNIREQNKYIQDNFDKPIELNKKYLIITGMDGEGTLEIGDNIIINTLLIKSEDIQETECEIYDLTKP